MRWNKVKWGWMGIVLAGYLWSAPAGYAQGGEGIDSDGDGFVACASREAVVDGCDSDDRDNAVWGDQALDIHLQYPSVSGEGDQSFSWTFFNRAGSDFIFNVTFFVYLPSSYGPIKLGGTTVTVKAGESYSENGWQVPGMVSGTYMVTADVRGMPLGTSYHGDMRDLEIDDPSQSYKKSRE